MKQFSFMTWRIFLGIFLCSNAYLAANEAPVEKEEEKAKEEHVVPGVRALSYTAWVETQTEREEQDKRNEANPELLLTENVTFSENSKVTTPFSAGVGSNYYTSHVGAIYNPMYVSLLGDQVTLQDGSTWVVDGGDTYKTLNWLTSDAIVISINHSWFAKNLFILTNQNTQIAVKCNMALGPVYNGLYTYWIVSINYQTQQICLNDGSIWNITGFDATIFNKWLPNDTVILGINDSFLSSSKPNILINVNTLTYVRAKCTW